MSEDTHKKYTPEQTAKKREEIVAQIAQGVGRVFDKHPELRSSLMLVSQFWSDEADDAVHCDFIFSKLGTPNLKAAAKAWDDDEDGDPTNLPEGLNHLDLAWTVDGYPWDDNGESIPLFAAFTKEDCDQEMSVMEAGAPYAVFRRSSLGVETELIGEMMRPWLDGVTPSWEQEGDAD
jgi:hypothetical protein